MGEYLGNVEMYNKDERNPTCKYCVNIIQFVISSSSLFICICSVGQRTHTLALHPALFI